MEVHNTMIQNGFERESGSLEQTFLFILILRMLFFSGGSKQFKYSKEDIEQKKIEALNRRRQKMAQSQQKNSNTRI